MEGLGAVCMTATPCAWRKVPPGCDDQQAKERIGKNESPGRSLVVEQPVQPVLYEAAAVDLGIGFHPEPHFERGERAGDSEPRLKNDDSNSAQVSESKPELVDPLPVTKIADDHQDE